MLKNILVLLLLGAAGLVGYVKLYPKILDHFLFDAEEEFKHPTNGRTRRFFIKTPPGFTSSGDSGSGSTKKWPVVIMIHGFTQNPYDVVR